MFINTEYVYTHIHIYCSYVEIGQQRKLIAILSFCVSIYKVLYIVEQVGKQKHNEEKNYKNNWEKKGMNEETKGKKWTDRNIDVKDWTEKEKRKNGTFVGVVGVSDFPDLQSTLIHMQK